VGETSGFGSVILTDCCSCKLGCIFFYDCRETGDFTGWEEEEEEEGLEYSS
jgi:hypothetical protein